jgi:Kinase/pyrophosphorylase
LVASSSAPENARLTGRLTVVTEIENGVREESSVEQADLLSSLPDRGEKERGQKPSIFARLSKFIMRLLGRDHESENEDMVSDLEPSSDHDLFEDLDQADIIILGLQRTTKRPTAKYLIREGFVVRCFIFDSTRGIPNEITNLPNNPLIVGLAKSPDQIVWVRKNMRDMKRHFSKRYFDVEDIDATLRAFRAVCAANGWKVIDVDGPISRTVDEIIKLYRQHGQAKR